MTEQHQSDARRVYWRMSVQLLAALTAAVVAPFVADALGWNLMAGIAVVAVALVLLAVWRAGQALRSTSASYVARLSMTHSITWVNSVVFLGVAGVVWLFVADEGLQGWEGWILLAYTLPMAAVSVVLSSRADRVREGGPT